jgi:hypothetical protein
MYQALADLLNKIGIVGDAKIPERYGCGQGFPTKNESKQRRSPGYKGDLPAC